MIEQVCAHIHNYFETDPVTGQRLIYPGTYTITDGKIDLPFMVDGQYFRVFGSELNDGVHLYKAPKEEPDEQAEPVDPSDDPSEAPDATSDEEPEEPDLMDETFTGVIWKMRPPREFLKLVSEISDWMDKYGDTMRNPYQSEDVIGVYRYTKMTSGKVTGDYIATWQNVYKDQLKEWRKLA